jgi:hypothetical protein
MSKLLIMRVFTFILLMTPFFLNSQSFVDSVYEFNVGDEFHYTHQHRTNSGTNTTKTIKKIIGKTYTSGFVSYQTHEYGQILIPNSAITTFSSLPGEVHVDGYKIYDSIPPCLQIYCGRGNTIYTASLPGLSYRNDSSSFEYVDYEIYGKYLGRIHYSESWIDALNPVDISEILVYYKSGLDGSSWGTPWNFTSSIDEMNSLEFSIYPNPTSNSIQINGIENSKTNYEILNSLGKLVISGTLESREIDCTTLPNGIYFLKLIDSEQNMGIKRIVVSK